MEEQKFQELVSNVSKRWERAYRLSIVYTVIALVGGSLWLAIAYYKANQYRKELEERSQQLNRREAELEKASLNLSSKQIALEVEQQKVNDARKAIEELGKLSDKPEAKRIARESLKAINAPPVSTPAPTRGAPTSASTPTKTSTPTPSDGPAAISRTAFKVSPGDKVSIEVTSVKTGKFFAIVKDGQTLTPPYTFTVDKERGETIFVSTQGFFTPDSPNDAAYKVTIIINNKQFQSSDILKTDPVWTRTLLFKVQ